MRAPGFVLALLAAAVTLSPLRAEKWVAKYFYDEDKSSLSLQDISFPSAQRGIACGVILEASKQRPVVLLTANGGARWTTVPVKDICLSIFFLDDSTGWMVTENGIWMTEESGFAWKKLKSPAGILRVWFQTRERGFAIGIEKTLLRTVDGGKTWLRPNIQNEPKSNPNHTAYDWVQFSGSKTGIVAGWSRPPRPGQPEFPSWLDPESALRRPDVPSMNLMLETRDGGETWKGSAASMFGRISRVAMAGTETGLGLVEFGDSFVYASELFRINLRNGASTRVYRDATLQIRDIAVSPGGDAIVAGIEPPGKLRSAPVPGKLRFLRARGMQDFTEVPCDYRAVGRRVRLAGFDGSAAWAATDQGMILKLEP